MVDWTSTALNSEEDAGRRVVLERLNLQGQGYLIAERYVPWWRFSEVALWLLLSPVLVIFLATKDRGVGSFVLAALAILINVSTVARRGIRLYCERTRVAHQFSVGGNDVEPVRIDILNQMEGGTLREFALGIAVAVALASTGGLVAWAIADGGGSKWIWPFLGLLACWRCFRRIHSYATSWAEATTA